MEQDTQNAKEKNCHPRNVSSAKIILTKESIIQTFFRQTKTLPSLKTALKVYIGKKENDHSSNV